MSKGNQVCLIRVTTSAGQVSTVLDAERFTVGRVGADFIVSDKGVSRTHLTVHLRGREIWIEDMASANGTFISGTRLPPNSPVNYKHGTAIQLGVSRDVVSFELVDRTMTQTAAQAEQMNYEMHPSRALGMAPPTEDIAHQTDQFLRSARETANGIKEAASRESESMINNARLKANDLIAKARAEADQVLERARNGASQATLDREAAAEDALAFARKESLQIKTAADEEAERIAKEARVAASQIKLTAQRESEELLRTARMKVATVKDDADREARELLRDAREKNRTAIEANEVDMELALNEARSSAQKIRAEADELLERARTYMQDKGEQVLKEAKQSADAIRAEAIADADRVREEARAEGLRKIETGLREAESEILQIKENARQSIEELLAAEKRIEFEVAEIEKSRSDLAGETELLEKERKELLAENKAADEQLTKVRGELERARADFALAKTMKENTDKNRDEVLVAQKTAQLEVDRMKKELDAAKAEMERELKSMREKGLLDFEHQKKQQDTELANLKLQMLDDLKARQIEEDKNNRTLKTHQMVEMTRHLEMLLVPKIQSKMGEREATLVIAELKQDLGPVVKRVILEESSSQSGSEIAHVISSDPIIERFKKREKMKLTAMISAPALAFLIAVFAPHWFEFARSPMEFVAGGKSAGMLAAERRARDIASKKSFTPKMVDEAGKSYADSVLYTKNYVGMKLENENSKLWILELERYMFHELGLPEQAHVSYIAIETRLVKELLSQREQINPDFEKESIARMRSIEEQTTTDLKGKVGGDVNYEKIREFERRFFEKLREKSVKK